MTLNTILEQAHADERRFCGIHACGRSKQPALQHHTLCLAASLQVVPNCQHVEHLLREHCLNDLNTTHVLHDIEPRISEVCHVLYRLF